MRTINLIVVHCSATRINQRFTVDMLRACHNARFHGKGVGYHYYIEKDGQLYQTRDEEPLASAMKEAWMRKVAKPIPVRLPSVQP